MIEMKTAILSQQRNPFRKFPLSALLGLLAAAIFLLQLTEQGSENFSLDMMVIALQAAFIGSVAATLICRLGGMGETLCHVAALFVAGIFFCLSFIIVPQSLYLVVIGGFGLALITIAPCFYKASQDVLWWHSIHVLIAFMLSFVVFAFWLSAFYTIEWMVQTLFALGVSLASLRDIVPAVGMALALLFFLSALPAGIREQTTGQMTEEKIINFDPEVEAYMRALFDFLLVPIIFVIGLVLHFYAAAILLRQAFPDGQIGKIVTFYVCFVLAVRFLIYPFLHQARLTSRIFCRVWVLIIIVPLTLLLVAVTLRSGQYGMTINRYYLYVGALSLIVIMLVQILPRWRHDIRLIPLIPSFFLIASIFGPWSVQNWVGISQARYLVDTYEKQGRLHFSDITLYDEKYHDIAQHINLLDETGQLSRLLPYIERGNRLASYFIEPPNTLPGSRPTYESFMQALGATPPTTTDGDGLVRNFAAGDLFINRGPVLDMESYDKVIPFLSVSRRGIESQLNSRQFATMRIEADEWLTLRYRDVTDRVVLREFIALASVSVSGAARLIQPVDLRSQGGRFVRLIPLEIHMDGEGGLRSLNMSVMLREAEWGR